MPRTLNALELLRRDHQQLLALMRRFEKVEDADEQRALCREMVDGLQQHTEIEERVFYPYLRDATAREDLFEEASIEHGVAKVLMERLPQEQPGTPRFKAMVKVLAEHVEHHVQEEEDQIFTQVERTGVDLEALGAALEDCRQGKAVEGEASAPARDPRADDADDDDDERFVEAHRDGLSKSTQRAKWIHTLDDRPERDGQTLATRNLEVIRAWAEERGGAPATTPGGDAENPRVLRFDFPGYARNLQPVGWDAWGRVFEDRELVFLYQQTKADGTQSNFFRLDSPEREDG